MRMLWSVGSKLTSHWQHCCSAAPLMVAPQVVSAPLGAVGAAQEATRRPKSCSRQQRHGGFRRCLHLLACTALAVWLVLPLWLTPTFLPPPSASPGPRLRIRHSPTVVGRGEDAAAGRTRQLALRIRRKAAEDEDAAARIAELEKKLAEAKAAAAAPTAVAQEEKPPSEVEILFNEVLEELPDLKQLDDARLGFSGAKQFVLDAGDNNIRNPIYKRKYEVLGATITQQEGYMKVFNRCVKGAKKSDKVETLSKMVKEKKRDKEFTDSLEALKKKSRLASLFFRDVLPEVQADPVQDTITGLLATAALLLGTALFFCCLFPPIPPSDY